MMLKISRFFSSQYIAEIPYTWGPYLYAYMGRQTEVYSGRDLFIMFKGFSKDMLPKRILKHIKMLINEECQLRIWSAAEEWSITTQFAVSL